MKTRGTILLAVALTAAGAHAESITHGNTTINMEFVNIEHAGNAGNPEDEVNGLDPGSVAYSYRIGMTEVSIGQFAMARTADSRIGDGDESYWSEDDRTVGTAGPASYVSAYEAMKFANWLTTGDAYSGAYQFDGGGTLTNVMTRAQILAAGGTFYLLPTEDEWYKAAYYRPVNDGSYSLYANGDDFTDGAPTHGTANGWNYFNSSFAVGSPNYMWATGYGGEEQNGTYDMMGNVWEWNESAYDGTLDNMAENRVLRGGTYNSEEYNLRYMARSNASPAAEVNFIGFRVAVIGGDSAPPIDVSIQSIPPGVEIGWTSESGTTYQVQYSTNLVSTNWFDLGTTVVGNGSTNFVPDAIDGFSMRFYRVNKN